VPGALFALCAEISPLPGPAHRIPAGFLAFIEHLIASGRFDVLLPTHEQGLLFAKVRDRINGRIAVALPSFRQLLHRAQQGRFSADCLIAFDLPQPPTRILKSQSEPRGARRDFGRGEKRSVGTASRGIWFVQNESELASRAARDRHEAAALTKCWCRKGYRAPRRRRSQYSLRGRLLGFHVLRAVAPGITAANVAIKESVHARPCVSHLEKLGAIVDWHGGLSADYIMPDDGTAPRLIDCNPRLVEPFNAWASGTDLVTQLLRVSLGEEPAPCRKAGPAS
jgi:hypothetical protein